MINHAYFERLPVTLVSHFKAVLNAVDHDINTLGSKIITNFVFCLNEDMYTTNAINFETLMAGMISGQMSNHQFPSIPSPHDTLLLAITMWLCATMSTFRQQASSNIMR